jgi:hypothetical protein
VILAFFADIGTILWQKSSFRFETGTAMKWIAITPRTDRPLTQPPVHASRISPRVTALQPVTAAR